MDPKTGAPQGKKTNIQVAATKAVLKKKTCRRLLNLALATPGRSLAPGRHKNKQVTRSVKSGLHFPVDQIGCYLNENRYSHRIGFRAPVYLVDILEYLTAEVLQLIVQAARESKRICIIPRHVMLGVMCDEDLSKLLDGVTIVHGGMLPNIHDSLFGDGTTEDAAKLPTEDDVKSREKSAESP